MHVLKAACLSAVFLFGSVRESHFTFALAPTAVVAAESESSIENHRNALNAVTALPRFNRAMKALAADHCDEAWRVLWSFAKTGDVEAVYLLATSAIWRGLIAPGSESQRNEDVSHYLLSVLIFGQQAPQVVEYGDHFLRQAAAISVESFASPTTGGSCNQFGDSLQCRDDEGARRRRFERWPVHAAEMLADCYRSDLPSLDCQSRAISEGVVPEFEAFVKRIDANIHVGDKAVCRGGLFSGDRVPTVARRSRPTPKADRH